MRHTKIVCTIGPSSESVEVLTKMIRAGMNVSRHNFSHGNHADHRRRVEAVREAAKRVGREVAIMLDLRGPKIRVGEFAEGSVELKAGDTFVLTTEDVVGNRERVSVNYPPLTEEVTPGKRILLSDGLIALVAREVRGCEVVCQVENDGILSDRKGVNLPDVRTSMPAVTEKDVKDLEFGMELGIDYVAASFVRRAEDMIAVRRVLEAAGSDVQVISKIETWEAVQNLDEIIGFSDAVMVARGDLGLEIAPEEVPLVQKKIIRRCNRLGKPVITATQMLESMIHNPRPTRAEASDVANAILDGTDAVMLSAETAVGDFAVEAVETMSRIATRVEADLPDDRLFSRKRESLKNSVTEAISYATCATASDLGAAAIITATQTGFTSRMVAKYRPSCPIIAVTPQAAVVRRMALVWGVEAVLVDDVGDTDGMIALSIQASLSAGLIKGGNLVVITAGVPVGQHGTTNLIKVHTVGNVLARGTGLGQGAVTGVVKLARTAEEAAEKIGPGDILVAPATNRDYVPYMERAAGLVTEAGGLTSHAAIVALQFGIPVIVGVDRAMQLLPEGEVVTIDGQRGLVYQGAAKVL